MASIDILTLSVVLALKLPRSCFADAEFLLRRRLRGVLSLSLTHGRRACGPVAASTEEPGRRRQGGRTRV